MHYEWRGSTPGIRNVQDLDARRLPPPLGRPADLRKAEIKQVAKGAGQPSSTVALAACGLHGVPLPVWGKADRSVRRLQGGGHEPWPGTPKRSGSVRQINQKNDDHL